MIKKSLLFFMLFLVVLAESLKPSPSNVDNILLLDNSGSENPAIFPIFYIPLYSSFTLPDKKMLFCEISKREKSISPLIGMGVYILGSAVVKEFSPKQMFFIQNDIQSTVNYQLRQ